MMITSSTMMKMKMTFHSSDPVDVLAYIHDGVVSEKTLANYVYGALSFVK